MKFKIVLFLSILFLFSCNGKQLKPSIDNSISSSELPDQESRNAKITFTENGKLKAVLYADNIKVIENQREKLLTNLKIDFYNKEEKKTSSLTSKKGRIEDNSQDMYAIENVVAISDSGVVLKTEELIWKNKTRKIVTDKFVRIENNQEITEGYGFESDQNMRNYTIFNITYIKPMENQK
ncbi:MAG: LPS export ABC transporter periplasmic protein LptC [Ignavibacteriae bacterium]|nr:MAG: LPS export ABC transporter periplasmic protein LptC [Ignavibacteriota bacterium]